MANIGSEEVYDEICEPPYINRHPIQSQGCLDNDDENLRRLRAFVSQENLFSDDDTTEETSGSSRSKPVANTLTEKMFQKENDILRKENNLLRSKLEKIKQEKTNETNENSGSDDSEAKKRITELQVIVKENERENTTLTAQLEKKEIKIMECTSLIKLSLDKIEEQKRANEQLKEENQRWKDIVSEIEHKKLKTSFYVACFKKMNNSFGFAFSIKHGRLFLNESNILIDHIQTHHLERSSQNICVGDFIMAVGECNVSSFTEENFNELLERYVRNADKIQLTLQKAVERPYAEYDIKFGEFSRKYQMKSTDLPLALVFYKDERHSLPENFPMRNYDIIQQINNQTSAAFLTAVTTKMFKGGTTTKIRRYFDTDSTPSQYEYEYAFTRNYNRDGNWVDSGNVNSSENAYDQPNLDPNRRPLPNPTAFGYDTSSITRDKTDSKSYVLMSHRDEI